MVTKRQATENAKKREALGTFLKTCPNPDPASLARSYGLPEPEVVRIIGGTDHA